MNADVLRAAALIAIAPLAVALAGCAQTAEPVRPCSSNWRDAFTPFEDPLLTRPPALQSPLQPPLPPELQPPAAQTNAAATASTGCASPMPASLQNKGPSAAAPLLTLAQAVQLALCHHPQVRASWSQIAQSAAALGQARSGYWPHITLSASRQRSRVRSPESPWPQERNWRSARATTQVASLTWRLWDFGARSAQTQAARLQLQAAQASQNATVRKALHEALQLYTEAQIAQTRLQAQQAMLPLMQRSLQAARRRQQEGAGSGNDTLQALSALARSQLELSRARGESDTALAQLAFATGLPPQNRYQLETLPWPASARQQQQANALIAQTLDQWLRQAPQKHPAILAARAQWQAAQAAIRVAQSEGLPSLDFSYNDYRNGRPNQSLSTQQSQERLATITLNIPLFDGFVSTYKVRNAQAQAEQKAIEHQNIQQQSLQEIVQLHAQAHAAWRNLDAANGLLIAASKMAASVQRQYQNGAADILQLNQAQLALQQAQEEHTRTQAEWLRARLKLALLDM